MLPRKRYEGKSTWRHAIWSTRDSGHLRAGGVARAELKAEWDEEKDGMLSEFHAGLRLGSHR